MADQWCTQMEATCRKMRTRSGWHCSVESDSRLRFAFIALALDRTARPLLRLGLVEGMEVRIVQSGRQLCFEITMLSGNTQILHVVCLMDSTGNPQIELFSKGLLSNHGNVKLTLPLYLHRCWNPGYRMKSFPCKRLFMEQSLGLHVPHHARHGPNFCAPQNCQGQR